MENQFKEVMSKKSTKELLEILKVKDGYQPAAIIAVEAELNLRESLTESGEIPIDYGNDFDFLKRVKASSENELINLYHNDYLSFSDTEANIINQELKKRNLEQKVWYYAKNNQKFGPFTRSEFSSLADSGVIDYYDYIWHDGLSDWTEAKNAQGLFKTASIPPRLGNNKPNWIQAKQIKTVGIIMSAIILFLTSIIWLLIGFSQTFYSTVSDSSSVGILGLWNIVISFACIAFGIGILLLKKWGYNWGLGTAVINIIWFGYSFLFLNASLLILFLLIAEIVTAVMLYSNRKQFVEEVIEIKI